MTKESRELTIRNVAKSLKKSSLRRKNPERFSAYGTEGNIFFKYTKVIVHCRKN